jgi:dihydroneopterin aldolase
MSEEGDCIHIEQLEVLARVGVTENERRSTQRLVINITVWPRKPFTALGDDIAETVNYSAIAFETRKLAETATCKLIETLADQMADKLSAVFPISKVRVEVRKFVLPGSEYVSVTTTRDAHN